MPVGVAEAREAALVKPVRLSASVIAPRSARVSTSASGLVEALGVALGDRVGRGDMVARLDRELVRHAVDRADAAVAEAEADLADARRRVRVGERLAERGNLPSNELEARQAQAAMAQAALARLQAEAARERENLRRRTITAPFDGVVARKVAEVGEWLSPGDTVVDLVAIDDLRVDIPVPQTYYPRLEGETAITLRFDALPGQTFAARRVARVPVSDPTARTFTLRVAPERADLPLTPGMSARATLEIDTGERGIVIPRDAVRRYPDGRTSVWVLDADDEGHLRVRERQIDLGQTLGGTVHVRDGLAAGTRVVERGNEALREGQRVRLAGESG